jgi:hypothetical protein
MTIEDTEAAPIRIEKPSLNKVVFSGEVELDEQARKNVRLYLERLGECGFCDGIEIKTNGYSARCGTFYCGARCMEPSTGYKLTHGKRVGMIEGRHEMPVEKYLLPKDITDQKGYDLGLWSQSVKIGRDYARKLVRESKGQPREWSTPEIERMVRWSGMDINDVLRAQDQIDDSAAKKTGPKPKPVVHLYLTGLTVSALALKEGLQQGGAEVVFFTYDRDTREYIPIPV